MAVYNKKDLDAAVRAYKKYGNYADTAAALGIAKRTVQRRVAEAKRLEGDDSDDGAMDLEQFRKGLLDARPKIWWDDFTKEEQVILLKIKRDHLAEKHRITESDILARCKAVLPSLKSGRAKVGLDKFRGWINDEETEEPEL